MYQDGAVAGPVNRAPRTGAQVRRVLTGLRASGKGQSIGDGVETQIRAELTAFIVMNFLFGDITRAPRDDDGLVEEGIIDSTGILELIEFLEWHFGIEVSEAETVPQNLGSISSLTRFVMSKQSVREPTS
jgi:acyl carrier protein